MNAIRLASVVAGVALLSGCMQARIEESREMATPIGKGDRVVVLAKPQIEGAGAEEDFMDCVGEGLGSGHDGVAVHDNNDFVVFINLFFAPRARVPLTRGANRPLQTLRSSSPRG